ncbi:hypothetical protein Maq22A_c11830 [Methylobacterium aquaticum]|uniref:Uncharacterized protein n=1 Tax=Methylobacterium aquaticum TaxID=270351 RepID=A0A0C6FF73_9HYPH|nr:hypothetical protein Maq22A_c11830 [Methylobacterium aquaticum]
MGDDAARVPSPEGQGRRIQAKSVRVRWSAGGTPVAHEGVLEIGGIEEARGPAEAIVPGPPPPHTTGFTSSSPRCSRPRFSMSRAITRPS